MKTATEPHERDLILDFWRGISVLLVIVHHSVYYHFAVFRLWYGATLAGEHAGNILFSANAALVGMSERAGPLGVRFFFIISGYIITKLLIEEEQKRGTISIRAFYIRRIFRILPPFLVYMLAVASFGAFGWISFDLQQFLNALGFLCNTESADCGLPVIHTWTLAIEQQFYLLWPILFLLVGKKHREQFLIFTLGILVAFSSTGVLLAHTWIDNAICFACITLGALYATSDKFRILMNRRSWLISLCLLLGVGALSRIPALNELAHVLYRDITPFLLLTCIATSYAFPTFGKTKMVWLVSRVGLISYSLYLWQQIFLMPPEQYIKSSPLDIPLLGLCIAILSYLYVEKPVVRWAKRQLQKTTLVLQAPK